MASCPSASTLPVPAAPGVVGEGPSLAHRSPPGARPPFLPGPWPVPAPSCSLPRQAAQSPSVVTLLVRHRVFRRSVVQEENIKTPLGIGVLLAFEKPPAAFPLGQGNRILRDECGASGRRCPAAPLCADGGHSEGHLVLCSGEGWEVWRTRVELLLPRAPPTASAAVGHLCTRLSRFCSGAGCADGVYSWLKAPSLASARDKPP